MSGLLAERAMLRFGYMYLLWNLAQSSRGHDDLRCWYYSSLVRERGARAHPDVLGYGMEMEVDGGRRMMYEKRKVFVNQSDELLWNSKTVSYTHLTLPTICSM